MRSLLILMRREKLVEVIFGTNFGRAFREILKQNCAYCCNGVIYDHCDVDHDSFGDSNKNNKTITCAVHDNDDEKAAT